MANQEHVKLIDLGTDTWNKWRAQHPQIHPDLLGVDLRDRDLTLANFSNADLRSSHLESTNLTGANLTNAVLRGSNLDGAILDGALLTGADLTRVGLIRAVLTSADLSNTELSEVNLYGADLSLSDLTKANLNGSRLIEVSFFRAKLVSANLRKAELYRADFTAADLTNAILTEANLTNVRFVDTTLEHANLKNCRVYGIAVWNIIGEPEEQSDLIITPPEQPIITVDSLEVAQFIYLLLNNQKIRSVIDTITSKVVLILGRFTPDRKAILDALRDALRHTEPSYVPVLFDFEKPVSQDYIETVSTLAHMARFVIADVTDPKIVLEEVPHIVRNITVPVQPLLLKESGGDPVTLYNLRRNHRSLLTTFLYKDIHELINSLQEKVIAPAEALAVKLRSR